MNRRNDYLLASILAVFVTGDPADLPVSLRRLLRYGDDASVSLRHLRADLLLLLSGRKPSVMRAKELKVYRKLLKRALRYRKASSPAKRLDPAAADLLFFRDGSLDLALEKKKPALQHKLMKKRLRLYDLSTQPKEKTDRKEAPAAKAG